MNIFALSTLCPSGWIQFSVSQLGVIKHWAFLHYLYSLPFQLPSLKSVFPLLCSFFLSIFPVPDTPYSLVSWSFPAGAYLVPLQAGAFFLPIYLRGLICPNVL